MLLQAGALDVYTTAIQMKKNRPGVKLSVLCRADDVEKMEAILFRETGTLGVRRWVAERNILARREQTVETPWGPVEGKVAELGEGAAQFSPEYESCRRLAEEKGVPLRDVYQAAQSGFHGQSN